MTKLQLSSAAFLVSFLACGWFTDDPLEQLFGELPAEQAVVAHIDIAGLRRSEALHELSAATLARFSGWARLSETLNLNPVSDFDAAVFSLGDRTLTAAVTGRFSKDRLRHVLADRGAECDNAIADNPCSLESSPRSTWFFFPGRERLVVLSAPDAAVDKLRQSREPQYRAHASEARKRLDTAFVWGVIHPRRLAEVMRDPPESWVNLSLPAKALEKARRARFSLEESMPASLRFRLIAECATPEEAAEQKGLLAGLSRFLAAAIEAGDRGQNAGEWSRVLRNGQFAHAGAEAVASWSIDIELLLERRQAE